MKRFIQFDDRLLRKIGRRCRINWILLLILNTLPQVSYIHSEQDENAWIGLLTRIVVISLLLFAIIYSLAYYSYMLQKHKKDVLCGIAFGVPAGIVFGLLCMNMPEQYGATIPCTIFGIAFGTIFGTYAYWPEWIPPATATIMGMLVATVATTTLIVRPYLIEGRPIEGLIVIGVAGIVCLLVNAFLIAIPAFIKAVRYEKESDA